MGRGQRFNPAAILKIREGLDLSQAKFAAKLNAEIEPSKRENATVSVRTVDRWEKGDNLPSLRFIHAICDAFNVDAGKLFTSEEPHPVPRKKDRKAH